MAEGRSAWPLVLYGALAVIAAARRDQDTGRPAPARE